MELIININKKYKSLEALCSGLNKASIFECYIDYDIWEVRPEAKNQVEPCIIFKKSGIHAVKLYFINTYKIKVDYIIPHKVMNAYFGIRPRIRQHTIEVFVVKLKEVVFARPQQKAFEELVGELKKVAS